MRRPTVLFRIACVAALGLCASCSSWKHAADHDGWTLYLRDGASVPTEEYRVAIDAALVAVEQEMGPFRSDVRVHAWVGDVEMTSGNVGEIREGGEDLRQDVPGIGPARVRAFHTRSSGWLTAAGIFLGAPDCGTAAHELVHARLAEEDVRVPLWFEEGYACLLGDGALVDGRWVVDGFSCWPYRELRDEALDEAELTHLLSIAQNTDHSVRENVLVHFVGWAVVFDLMRELGTRDWRVLYARFTSAPDPVAEARTRMERSLRPETPLQWLDHAQASGSPAARLAAVKGTWKLDSIALVLALLQSLARERDDEARAAIAVNLLATPGQAQLPEPMRARLWYEVIAALGTARVSDPAEAAALRALHRAYHDGDGSVDPQTQLTALARFWQE